MPDFFSYRNIAMEPVKKHLSCSICLQLFKSPRTLQCLHTFCELCLEEHIKKTASTFFDSKKTFECPVCMTRVSPVNKNKATTEWAKDFPLNSFIPSLLEGRCQNVKPTSQSDSISKRCFPCSIDGKTSDVFAFCTKCIEFLCKECFNDHRKFKTTRSHCVLKGSEIPTDITHFQKLAVSNICKTHSNKEVEFKCVNHDEFMCSMCAVTVHKHCDTLVPLQNLDKPSMTISEDILEGISKAKQSAEQELSDTFAHAQKLTIEVSKLETMKQSVIEKIIPVVRYIKGDFGASYAEYAKLQQSKLTSNIVKCAGLLNSLIRLKEYASVVMKYGTPSQIELSRREILPQEKEMCNSIQLLHSTDHDEIPDCLTQDVNVLMKLLEETLGTVCSLTSNASETVDKFKSTKLVGPITTDDSRYKENIDRRKTPTGLKNDVSLSYKDTETQTMAMYKPEWTTTTNRKETETQTSALDCEQQIYADTLISSEDDSSASARTYKTLHHSERSNRSLSETRQNRERVFSLPHRRAPATYLDRELHKVGQYDLSIAGKTMGKCSHKASVIRTDGWMVLMDAENKIIKLVDPGFEVKSYKVMEVQPLDICLTVNETIAVATSKGICLFPIKNEALGKANFFPMKYDPVSICSVGENLAILCSRKRENKSVSFIQIRKINNEVVKQIDTFTNNKGKTIELYDPRMIRKWEQDEFIICEPKYVKRFGNDGNLKWFYTEQDLQNLTYIACDSEKNIYTCDLNRGYLYQVSSYSYYISRIIAYGIGKPSSVVFNPINKTLVIGCLKDNNVFVYKFKEIADTHSHISGLEHTV